MRDSVLTVEHRKLDLWQDDPICMKWAFPPMRDPTSLLLILSADPGLGAQAERILEPFGWRIRSVAKVSHALDALTEEAVAAMLVSAAEHDLPELAAAVRALPAPANGTPILGDMADPLDEDAFTERLEHWAGPLGDHALRAPPFDARYRLVRLIGWDNASGMLERFRAALEDAIATAARNPDAVPAHRLAGLAGMIGYADLHRLWSNVDAGDPDYLIPAVEASKRALTTMN